MLADSGAKPYACKASVEMFDLTIDECEPADIIALEHVGAVFRRENEELWLLHGEQAAAGCREAARK